MMSLDMSYYFYEGSHSAELGITRFVFGNGSHLALDGSGSDCNEKQKHCDQLVRVCIYIVVS